MYKTFIHLNEIYSEKKPNYDVVPYGQRPCHRQLLLVVGDKVDDDLRLRLRRVDDHSVRVVMITPARQSARWRRHLLPLVPQGAARAGSGGGRGRETKCTATIPVSARAS
jgi:hypothetical protein